MKSINNIAILITIIVITILLIPLVLFTDGPARIVIGIGFVIFFPGYALLSVLFPRHTDLGGIERIALSFGTSIAIVPLIGLILYYTPWGIRLIPVLVTLSTFIIAVSLIACFRLLRLNKDERFHIDFSSHPLHWPTLNKTDKILTGTLIAVIVIALGSLIFVVTNPKQGEAFSEFYTLLS